jgi:hypothetical protein
MLVLVLGSIIRGQMREQRCVSRMLIVTREQLVNGGCHHSGVWYRWAPDTGRLGQVGGTGPLPNAWDGEASLRVGVR